ncbi:isochorismatase family cysteine hydrolase [Streptomyces sp. NPDC102441]|uniref:isochorismatase family cysteine hydrolase n=1 Tax=Streptomyces sp. NPDC102441 TaxID=3366176 RepID=UPI003822F118
MSRSALIVVDMLNTYGHSDAEALIPSVREALPRIVGLIERARGGAVPVIYVNDNFGEWRSHHGEIIDTTISGPHSDLVEPVLPDENSLFVVKARHSIFYETPLSYLLSQLDVGHVILCGQVTEQCILYSALDAHIRHLDVTIPEDAVAHIHQDLAQASLRMMERNMDASIRKAEDIEF